MNPHFYRKKRSPWQKTGYSSAQTSIILRSKNWCGLGQEWKGQESHWETKCYHSVISSPQNWTILGWGWVSLGKVSLKTRLLLCVCLSSSLLNQFGSVLTLRRSDWPWETNVGRSLIWRREHSPRLNIHVLVMTSFIIIFIPSPSPAVVLSTCMTPHSFTCLFWTEWFPGILLHCRP